MKALDKNFTPIAEIDVYESLILHLKYFDCGIFELYANQIIPEMQYCYLDEFQGGNVGIVESMTVNNGVIYKGRLLKQLLDNKVVSRTRNFYKKTAEQIAKALVQEFALQDITVETDQGLGTPVTIQVTGDNLMEFCDKLLETQDLGCEIIYDYESDVKVFRVFQGADNTGFAPLSTNFENISSAQYTRDISNMRNFAYVAGEVQEGQPRTIVTVDLRKSPDDEKLEIWVDARDLQSEVYDDAGETVTLSAEEYKETLRQRGVEKLQEYVNDESCAIKPDIDLTLGEQRYFCDDETGVESIQRVTEIIYAKEGNTIKKDVVWGKQKIRRNVNV